MIKEKLKTSNKNQMKKYVIYVILLISNILLFIGLIRYCSTIGIHISLKNFDDISAIIATMFILGFISLKLPEINDIGDHAIYGIAYIIIICIVGLITSYFGEKLNILTFFASYLEMFKILCGVLIFVLLATNLKSFKEIINGKFTRRNLIVSLIIFTIVGLFASYAHVNIENTPANIRCLIVMISGLFGGPVVGIPVGIISGAYRLTLGGATAIPCTITTVLSGVIGSLIFMWNDKKFPKITESVILMFLFTGFEMLLVVIMTPPDISFNYINNIYLIMLFGSVMGMLLFSIVLESRKETDDSKLSYEEQKIREFEDEIKELKNEIKELKSGDNPQDEE